MDKSSYNQALEGNPSINRFLKSNCKVTTNKSDLILNHFVSDQSLSDSSFKLLIIPKTKNFDTGIRGSKFLSRSTGDSEAYKYIIYNTANEVKGQSLIINEKDVEGWFGKKLKIILEKVDEVKERSLQPAFHHNESQNLKIRPGIVAVASEFICERNSIHRIIKTENLDCDENLGGITEFKPEIVTDQTSVEGSDSEDMDSPTNLEDTDILDTSNLTSEEESDIKDMEFSNVHFLRTEVKLESDTDGQGVLFETAGIKPTNLPTARTSYILYDTSENWHLKNVSNYEIIEDYLDCPMKSETSHMCEDAINDEFRIDEDIAYESINKIIKHDGVSARSTCPAKLIKNETLCMLPPRREKLEIPALCAESPGKSFDENTMNTHLKNVTNPKLYACAHCTGKYFEKSALRKHIKTHTSKKTFTCRNCDATFTQKSHLITHIRTHTGEKPFTCTHCNLSFSQKSNLIKHIRTHTGKKPFTCTHCNLSFSQKSNLIKHIRTHTGEKPFTCTHCNLSFSQKSHLTTHIRTHTGKKPFTCTDCTAKYTNRGALIYHMRTHTSEKPFTCTHCNSKFTQKSHLITHIRTHTGEKPFTCTHCNSKFTRKSHLITHIRTHTGEKPFTCTHCNSKFTRKSHLTTHIRTHTGEKPFKCTDCTAKYTNRGALIYHMRTHAGKKPYTCTHCNLSFSQKSNLIKHIRTHTGENPIHAHTAIPNLLERAI